MAQQAQQKRICLFMLAAALSSKPGVKTKGYDLMGGVPLGN